MKYLLDTNVLSEAVKKERSQIVLSKLKKHQGEMATAASVWHELVYGCLRLPQSKKKKVLQAYLQDVILPNIPILPYDQRAANWHAEQRSRLTAAGKTPPFVDGQIAAIAFVNGLCLVTRNLKDYKPFDGVQLENWHSR
jgi:tRNA(fMet)-specific endonuclease VapC